MITLILPSLKYTHPAVLFVPVCVCALTPAHMCHTLLWLLLQRPYFLCPHYILFPLPARGIRASPLCLFNAGVIYVFLGPRGVFGSPVVSVLLTLLCLSRRSVFLSWVTGLLLIGSVVVTPAWWSIVLHGCTVVPRPAATIQACGLNGTSLLHAGAVAFFRRPKCCMCFLRFLTLCIF